MKLQKFNISLNFVSFIGPVKFIFLKTKEKKLNYKDFIISGKQVLKASFILFAY